MSGAVVYFVECVAYGEHDTISCQKGLGLVYRKRDYRRIVL